MVQREQLGVELQRVQNAGGVSQLSLDLDFHGLIKGTPERRKKEKGNMMNICKMAMGTLASVALVGCATIMGKGAAETLNVRSTPDQAAVLITDESGTRIFEGKTPTTLPLEKKRGYFSGKKYTVRVVKEGYKEHLLTVDTNVNAWYIAGNFVFGGLVGWLIVDPATGAMWSLDTNEINAGLTADVARQQREDTSIVLLQDVPTELRSRMVRVER